MKRVEILVCLCKIWKREELGMGRGEWTFIEWWKLDANLDVGR